MQTLLGGLTMNKFISLIVIAFLFTGCTATIIGLPISQQNIERLRANAVILAKTSPLQVAYLKAALGSDLQKLPEEAVNCLDKIMAICAKPDLTDEDLGAIAGHWDRAVMLMSPGMLQQVISILQVTRL